MPLPGDVTFRRKGEYAPAAIENMDEVGKVFNFIYIYIYV